MDNTRGMEGNALLATPRSRRRLAGLVGGLFAGGGAAALIGWNDTDAKKHKKKGHGHGKGHGGKGGRGGGGGGGVGAPEARRIHRRVRALRSAGGRF